MSIADQLKRAKDDLDAVYAAGKAAGGGGDNPLKYATQVQRVFYKAVFPEEYELTFENPTCPANIMEMFRMASNLRKLTIDIPTDKAYNASYLVYDNSDYNSTLEEIVLPDGIKFSNFAFFAHFNKYLKTVSGAIDLSESTSNSDCFRYCTELVDVRFVVGTITKSISFAQSAKLSDASITSIVNGLSADALEQTLTVHPDVAARIIKTDVTDKGWSLAY